LIDERHIGQSEAQPNLGERIVLSAGACYTSIVLTTLLLSYLPGGLTQQLTLLAFNLLILLLAALLWLNRRTAAQPSAAHNSQFTIHYSQFIIPPNRWLFLGFCTLALTGGFFRFANLGYAEFQGDEARLALHAAEVIQGHENVLLLHKKGPTEILLPTAIYVLSDRLNEVTARLPFSIANFVALLAVFLLGRRLGGPVAGWVAAMLLALDGYLVAFGRVVQYQSVVFLMDVLVVLIFVRLAERPKALTPYFTLAAIFMATALLSHYEAALVLFPVLYLLWRIWRQGIPLATLARALAVPMLAGGALLASFYVPFVLNPGFYDTYYYLTDYRVGAGSLFNHLQDFFARTTVYSSTYYLLTLIILTVIGLATLYVRNLRWPAGWLLAALFSTGMILIVVRPGWLILSGADYTWLFFVLALAGAWLLPNFPPSQRVAWLWFGAPMILALFFTAIPNTHVYGFFIPWALVVGQTAGQGWNLLRTRFSLRTAQGVAVVVAAAAILIFGLYEYRLFVYNRVEVLRTWPEHRPASYWTSYDMPVEIAIFGFPLNNGWKAVAGLYADGILQGDYDTNARDVIAEWYTRGDHFCVRDDPRYYILTNRVEPTLADETAQLRSTIATDHKLFGAVYVQGRSALEIFEHTTSDLTPRRYDVEDYEDAFDGTLSAPWFERNGPGSGHGMQHPVNFRLGEAIWLKGYTLDRETVRSGERIHLSLYWETTQPVTQDYKVFVQVIDLADLAKAGQRDGAPGCARYPATIWLPGSLIADHYTLALEPDARPGRYTVLVGMYNSDGRLELFGEDGQSLGDQLPLAEVEIQP
jgi:hypothetical protein